MLCYYSTLAYIEHMLGCDNNGRAEDIAHARQIEIIKLIRDQSRKRRPCKMRANILGMCV